MSKKMMISRRQVLFGAGGFTLAIPFLPSLLKRSRAGDAPFAANPRFVALGTMHGGIWPENMFPADSAADEASTYAGYEIRRGALAPAIDGGRASLSPVLTGSSSVLTPTLAAKMNVINGLDISFYIGHHTGGHLGNYARNDANGSDGATVNDLPMPTIDQVMAYSSSYYPTLDGNLRRSMNIGASRMSYGWSNPGNQSGSIEELDAETSSLALFNQIFLPDADPVERRSPIADRILENYQRLRNSDRRLSAADKQRLDDHIERVDELQRKLNVVVSCGDIVPPTRDSEDVRDQGGYGTSPELQGDYWQLFNDVIVTAFSCGTSKIATMLVNEDFTTFAGDWHADIAHQAHLPDGNAQGQIASAHQKMFESMFLDLIAKLDAVEDVGGVTLLDNSLVQWTQESGAYTHEPIGIPVITGGSAAGYLTTGSYIDYRNLDRTGSDGGGGRTYTGLTYNQWLGTVLQAMGLSPEEYESGGSGGYGVMFDSNDDWYGGYGNYEGEVLSRAGEVLPLLKAT